MKRHERLNQLVDQHLHLVVLVCRCNRNAVKKLGRDEAESVGQLALVQASRSWDGIRPFDTYARITIQKSIRLAARPGLPHVPLNGHDPEDHREWFPDGPEVASVLTDDEKKFMQHIEDSRMGPREAHKALAQRRKQRTEIIRNRHRRIILRIAEASNE